MQIVIRLEPFDQFFATDIEVGLLCHYGERPVTLRAPRKSTTFNLRGKTLDGLFLGNGVFYLAE